MPEENIAPGANVEAPATTEVINDASPAKVDNSVDEKVKEILGDIPTVEETKKPGGKPVATQPEKVGDEEEKKIENVPVEKQPEAPQNLPVETIGRLDRRIAKLYQSNRILKGEEGDVDIEQLLLEIKNYPLPDKKKALNNLLSEQRLLRTGRNDGMVDLSEEDHDAIVEAEVENRLQSMQTEIQKREWSEDLVKTVDAHPELDERKNEYDARIATAVEKLAQKGMKVSEAYQLVTESISSAKATEEKDAELNKQKILSGAVSASNESAENKGKLTWEELTKRQEADPNYINSEEYLKMAREGKLPKE